MAAGLPDGVGHGHGPTPGRAGSLGRSLADSWGLCLTRSCLTQRRGEAEARREKRLFVKRPSQRPLCVEHWKSTHISGQTVSRRSLSSIHGRRFPVRTTSPDQGSAHRTAKSKQRTILITFRTAAPAAWALHCSPLTGMQYARRSPENWGYKAGDPRQHTGEGLESLYGLCRPSAGRRAGTSADSDPPASRPQPTASLPSCCFYRPTG